MSPKYAVITAYREEYDVRMMCAALGVSASGYYAAHTRPPSARAVADAALLEDVRAAHQQSRKRYGAPRIQHALCTHGTRVGTKRVARLMREDGLVGRRRRRFVHTTDSAHVLHLEVGDKVYFDVRDDGSVLMIARNEPVEGLFGVLRTYGRTKGPLTIEEMNPASLDDES